MERRMTAVLFDDSLSDAYTIDAFAQATIDLDAPDETQLELSGILQYDPGSIEETADTSVDTPFTQNTTPVEAQTPASDVDNDDLVCDNPHCVKDYSPSPIISCVWWSPYGFGTRKHPIHADRLILEHLHDALNEHRLYVSRTWVGSPYEALTASLQYWQKRGELPSPYELDMFESMSADQRYLRGMRDVSPDNCFIQTCEPYLQEIVAKLQRLEMYAHYVTGVSKSFQLGVIKEVHQAQYKTFTAGLMAGRSEGAITTIWIHQKLVHDACGDVRIEWSALTDSTLSSPIPTPHLAVQHGMSQPVTPGRSRSPAYPRKGKKRARSLSPPTTPRKHTQTRWLELIPPPIYNQPPPVLPHSPSFDQLRSHHFPLPYPAEATRRSKILAGHIPPRTLLDSNICPREYILAGAKLLTNTVILLLAKHFSNSEIFNRINEILKKSTPIDPCARHTGPPSSPCAPPSGIKGREEELGEEEDHWRPLRDPNVITRRITVAVESEARRRGVNGWQIRQEIHEGRERNGVVTGRGKGVRRRVNVPVVAQSPPRTGSEQVQVQVQEQWHVQGEAGGTGFSFSDGFSLNDGSSFDDGFEQGYGELPAQQPSLGPDFGPSLAASLGTGYGEFGEGVGFTEQELAWLTTDALTSGTVLNDEDFMQGFVPQNEAEAGEEP